MKDWDASHKIALLSLAGAVLLFSAALGYTEFKSAQNLQAAKEEMQIFKLGQENFHTASGAYTEAPTLDLELSKEGVQFNVIELSRDGQRAILETVVGGEAYREEIEAGSIVEDNV